jgi:hypothetical protein
VTTAQLKIANMAEQDPNDIRKWLSPKSNSTTPKRRRRVMSTSSSDNERHASETNTAAQHTPSRSAPLPIAAARIHGPPLPTPIAEQQAEATTSRAQDVIELSSSDDSMYIYARPTGGGAAVRSPKPDAEQLRSSSQAKRRRRNTKPERSSRGKSSSQSQKFTVEAEEASTDHESECESCAESDMNAQDLYHEAIMGVRRANNARTQLRNATINCPVCAKFASYLQHFTS